MEKIVYCFISHSKVINEDYDRISSMMQSLDYNNYLIFYGGNYCKENEHIKYIYCDDSYIGLPNKINHMCKYINDNESEIDFIVKLDRTVKIRKIFDYRNFPSDYCGRLILFRSGTYHFKRCEQHSKWYNKEFIGEPIFYCSGGGYVLSKKAINIIAKDNLYHNHVYEDYYVGFTLRQNGIVPKRISLKDFLYDPEHAWIYH